MTTTLNLPDELLSQARELARREQTTVADLIETGLRIVVAERSTEPRFRLPDASVGGRGLQPAFPDASWKRVRNAIHPESTPTSWSTLTAATPSSTSEPPT